MSILQKIRKFRTNHKIAAAISDGAAVFAAGNAGAAVLDSLLEPQSSHTSYTSQASHTPQIQLITEANADFYDGCRGPNTLQLDQRIAFGENSAANYTLLPKFLSTVMETEKDYLELRLLITPLHTSQTQVLVLEVFMI